MQFSLLIKVLASSSDYRRYLRKYEQNVLHCMRLCTVGEMELDSVRRVTGNIVSSQVSFLLKPDDNGAEYSCNASNDATVEPLVAAVNLRVSCTLQCCSPLRL